MKGVDEDEAAGDTSYKHCAMEVTPFSPSGEIVLNDTMMKHFKQSRFFDLEPYSGEGKGLPKQASVISAPTVESIDYHESEPFLVCATTDHVLRIFDTRKGEPIGIGLSKKYGVSSVRFTPHPTCVIYASTKFDQSSNEYLSNHAIRDQSTHDEQYIRFFKGHTEKVLNIEMSKSTDTFFSASMDKTVRQWDLRQEREVLHMDIAKEPLTLQPYVAVDKQDMLLAVGHGGGLVKLYDPRNISKPFHTIAGASPEFAPSIFCMKFSNTADMIAVGIQRKIYLYDCSTQGCKVNPNEVHKPMHVFVIGNEDFNEKMEFSFSPDDQYILSGHQDGSVRIWRTKDGVEVTCLKGNTGKGVDILRCLKFNPHEAQFATGSLFTKLWNLEYY